MYADTSGVRHTRSRSLNFWNCSFNKTEKIIFIILRWKEMRQWAVWCWGQIHRCVIHSSSCCHRHINAAEFLSLFSTEEALLSLSMNTWGGGGGWGSYRLAHLQQKNKPVIVVLTVYLEHRNFNSLVKRSFTNVLFIFTPLLWFSTGSALV